MKAQTPAKRQKTSELAKKVAQPKRKPNVPRNYTTVNLGLGFPKRLCCTLKYTGSASLTSTAGSVATLRYSCNGLFDPNISGVGHQPLYFDNLMAIYNHYTVIGSKLTARFCPSSASTGPGIFAIMQNDDTTAAGIDVPNVTEQTLSTGIRLIPIGLSSPMSATLKWSAKRTFGGSVLANDNLQGNATSNPLEQSYYDMRYQDSGGGNSALIVYVEVEYTAIFDELKDQAEN